MIRLDNIGAQQEPVKGDEIPGTGGVVPNVTVDVPKDQADKINHEIFQQLFGKTVTNPTPDPVIEKAVDVLTKGTI